MTTLATMKSRIAREIGAQSGRLDTDIAAAIATAIDEHQKERFWFNDTHSVSFSTVADQEYYDSTDDADIPNVIEIEHVKLDNGSNSVFTLRRKRFDEIQAVSDSTDTGQPTKYSLFNDEIRLWPIPDAAYTVTISGHISKAAPATDIEEDNVWMTTAEKLIRSTAKRVLFQEVIYSQGRASIEANTEAQALARLLTETNKRRAVGKIEATTF